MRGEVVSSFLILLAVLVVAGFGLGEIVSRVEVGGNLFNYKKDVSNVYGSYYLLTQTLFQERKYVVDEGVYLLLTTGGFGLSLKGFNEQSLGLKTMSGDVPEFFLPYYGVNLGTSGEMVKFPDNSFMREKLLDFFDNGFVSKVSDDISFSSEMSSISVADDLSQVYSLWSLGSLSFSSTNGLVEYLSELSLPVIIDTGIPSLRVGVEKFVNEGGVEDFFRSVSTPLTTISGYYLVGVNCVDNVCESEKSFSPVLGGDSSNVDEIAGKRRYCSVSKFVSGCDNDVCKVKGVSFCEESCFNDEPSLTCPTPRSVCEDSCNNDLTPDLFFVWSCDDWEKNSNGEWVCVSADWYPRLSVRTLDGDFVEPSERLVGEAEYEVYGFKNLTANKLCVSGPFRGDSCCQRSLTPPQPLTLSDLGSVDYCRPSCFYSYDNNCAEETVNTLSSLVLKNRSESGFDYWVPELGKSFDVRAVNPDIDVKSLVFDGAEVSVKYSCDPCENGSVSHGKWFSSGDFVSGFSSTSDYWVSVTELLKPGSKPKVLNITTPFNCSNGNHVTNYNCCPNGTVYSRRRFKCYNSTDGTYVDRVQPRGWYYVGGTFFCPLNSLFWNDECVVSLVSVVDVLDLVKPSQPVSLVSSGGSGCSSDWDCDKDLTVFGLRSVCVNNVCVSCDSSNEGRVVRGGLYCDGSSWVSYPFSGSCSVNNDCDPLGSNNGGWRSICADNVCVECDFDNFHSVYTTSNGGVYECRVVNNELLFLGDGDGDGYNALVDCDDSNSNVHPGAGEGCDDLDNDCDGVVDEGCGSGTSKGFDTSA